jgi:hypothetical protein
MIERRYATLPATDRKSQSVCRFFSAAGKYPGQVVLFVGKRAHEEAETWRRACGHGSALSISRSNDPSELHWPAARSVLIAGSGEINYARLMQIIRALLRDGVGEVEVPDRGSVVTVYRREE